MKEYNEKIPNPKKIEKEISDFLTKKFGGNVKIVSPLTLSQKAATDKTEKTPRKNKLNFNLKPEELVSYLDQYIVKQDSAKAILSTKICTHFNRIRQAETSPGSTGEMVGSIKNNVLMVGPTGVGKTYMIRLIANKIGVPFVKGDATKFSETGYVGGDVEDLVRDLAREADDDLELAQYGIIYIDEIDKIASSRNIIGADVSRTGVQRALLKPLEETEVDLKVPHDPISMIQEIERFRKTGERDKRTINTKNILFIVSGAFSELAEIVKKRIVDQGIGFGAQISSADQHTDIIKQVKSEDLIEFGFESEFVGRLPVRAIFESLTEEDLFEILKNPNNPIILGKKLDFAAYGIAIKFDDTALRLLAKHAYEENTGARGLISAIEWALLIFEKKLPSTDIKIFPVTSEVIEDSKRSLDALIDSDQAKAWDEIFEKLAFKEKEYVKGYIESNQASIAEKCNLKMTPARIDIIATLYGRHVMDIWHATEKIKSFYDEIKKIELSFFKEHDINIVLEEDAVDFVIEQLLDSATTVESFYDRLSEDLKLGLNLILEKTGKNRFFINVEALTNPHSYLDSLIKTELSVKGTD